MSDKNASSEVQKVIAFMKRERAQVRSFWWFVRRMNQYGYRVAQADGVATLIAMPGNIPVCEVPRELI